MYLTENLQKKWEKVLNHKDLPEITDPHKKAVVSLMLENQSTEARRGLQEGAPANQSGAFPNNANLKGYDSMLISLMRRALPNMIAFDICGVQPMTSPSGMIFALKSKYVTQAGVAQGTPAQPSGEALHWEAATNFSGGGTHTTAEDNGAYDPFTSDVGTGLSTAVGEALGGPTQPADGQFAEMAFSIDKIVVEAKSRKLQAGYTLEIAQDLQAAHGLDAESELANMLSAEILAEINREVVRTIYNSAVAGAQTNVTTPGQFDLDVDANGRWSVEKYKGLMVRMEMEANAIAKETRRGRGNIAILDSDTAACLSIAGLLDCGSALKDSLNVDDTGNTFVGILNNRHKVFIDPYVPAGINFCVMGFKGATQYDAGLFYCPYVPLQMVRAVGEQSMQPKIGFMTRYGLVANPFSNILGTSSGAITANSNVYYRKMRVLHLL